MKTAWFAFAAACALPLPSASSAQSAAPIDFASLHPVSGSWSYSPIQNGSEAAFVDATAARRLIVRCNRASRTVSIIRTGVPAAAATLSIWTSSMSRSVPARFLPTKMLIADLATTDPLLDAIAFSRGGIATGAEGAPLLPVPAWPEPSRVIEDCRS